MVKYVVKGILPHFRGTFKSGDWGKFGENGGVHNILESRTGLVLRLPKRGYQKLQFLERKLCWVVNIEVRIGIIQTYRFEILYANVVG